MVICKKKIKFRASNNQHAIYWDMKVTEHSLSPNKTKNSYKENFIFLLRKTMLNFTFKWKKSLSCRAITFPSCVPCYEFFIFRFINQYFASDVLYFSTLQPNLPRYQIDLYRKYCGYGNFMVVKSAITTNLFYNKTVLIMVSQK